MPVLTSDQDTCLAQVLLEVIPPLAHIIKAEIRITTNEKISLLQYRILINIHRGFRYVGQLSEQHGVSEAAMSRSVDGLTTQGWVTRIRDKGDRRHINLKITQKGTSFLNATKKAAEARLRTKMEKFDIHEQVRILKALETLRASFLITQNS